MHTMPIRVAFNATPLLSPLTGIGNYIVQIGRALAAHGDIDAYSFYRYRWRHERPQPPRELGVSGPTRVQRLKPWVPFRGLLRQAVHRLGFSSGLLRHRIQVYHEQNYIPLAYNVPVVITIHDLSWVRYPETHPLDRVRWLERGLPKALARASAVLVDSDFVRAEVLATFGVAPERVRTAYLGVSDDYRPRAAKETAATLRELDLMHGGYLLTVGTIEPRKNLTHALEAYADLPAEVRERYPLVVAGAQGWRASAMVIRLRQLAERGQIRFLGHVSAAALPDLYAGAALFVFPSLYEGFGLPPLEAMASGTPVLVSDRASLPEVVGDAGATIDPEQPEITTAKIAEMLGDPALRAAMVTRGLARAAGFTWEACAAVARDAYRRAL
jgi:O-antigen biosynthesis alpha-1,3-rhamnosyltransferase